MGRNYLLKHIVNKRTGRKRRKFGLLPFFEHQPGFDKIRKRTVFISFYFGRRKPELSAEKFFGRF